MRLLPRFPTDAMQKAGLEAMFAEDGGDVRRRQLYAIVRKGWRAMYDAAPETAPETRSLQELSAEVARLREVIETIRQVAIRQGKSQLASTIQNLVNHE